MALDTDCLILQKELASLLKDLKLFSKTVDDTDTLNILNVKRTIQKLEHLIPTIKSLLDGATTMDGNLWNDGKNRSDFVQTMLCSELALFSPQWAVWVQNEFSLMFMEVSNVCEVPSVTNFVTFEFHHSTNSKAVIFFCIPKKLGIRLKFIVQPCELVKSVAGLLKSFQSTVVLANKIQEPVGSKMKNVVFVMN